MPFERREPYKGRGYNPCCGSAGMFVQREAFVDAYEGRIAVYGQESDSTTQRLAIMHLAIRGIVFPKVLVVENVSGALSGEHARYLKSLDNTMRDAGYRTHTMRCQAADLGMAQLRCRVFFFAWRTGNDIEFTLPKVSVGELRSVLAGASKQ